MMLRAPKASPRVRELQARNTGLGQLRVKLGACGVYRNDLHVIDSQLTDDRPPVIPGYGILDRVDSIGRGVTGSISDRFGMNAFPFGAALRQP